MLGGQDKTDSLYFFTDWGQGAKENLWAQETTRHVMYLQCNIEARSRNHRCSGNANKELFSFPHIHKLCDFLKTKLLRMQCVFCVSLQLLSITFLFLRTIQPYNTIYVHRPSLKYPYCCQILIKLEFS